jgi:hypothetical protein
LLRRHYRRQRIPAIFDERFIQVLHQNGLFEDWPLETIVPDAQPFFAFLQERWPAFLDSLVKQKGDVAHENTLVLSPEGSSYGFKYAGPALLPFDHDDVRVYIDNLFLEGLLQPVSYEHAEVLAKTWVAYGIKASPMEDYYRRLEGLIDSIEKTLPTIEVRYEVWFRFAYRWAELVALVVEPEVALPEK